MNAHTKPCHNCKGKGSYGHELLGINQCHACKGTGRVPDVEATLRAENATLRESLERALVCLYGVDATLDDARKVSTVEAALRAELDAARAEVERLRDVAEKQSRGRRAALTGLLRMARRKIPPGPVAPPVPLDVQAAHEREVSDLYATIASVTGERDAARAENERLKAIIEARDEADGAPYRCGRCDGGCNDLYGSGPDAMCRRCYSAKRDADEVVQLTAEVDRITALYRKADDGHDENMRETARLIGEVERLTAREREAASMMRNDEPGHWRCPSCDRWAPDDASTRLAAWLAGCKS